MKIFTTHGIVAVAAVATLSLGSPALMSAQSPVPQFLQEGKTYVMVFLDTEQELEVLALGTGPWIKVADDRGEFWLNLNHVVVIRDYADAMKRDLVRLVAAQASFLAARSGYATSLS